MFAPLTFLQQRDGKIVIQNNGYLEDYTTIHYYKNSEPDKITTVQYPQKSIFQLNIKDSDDYTFYTRNTSGETSIPLHVFLSTEKLEDILKKINNYIASPFDKEYIDDQFLKINHASKRERKKRLYVPFLQHAVAQYKKLKDVNTFEVKCYYQILNAIERYEAMQAISSNEYARDIRFLYSAVPQIIPNKFTTHIDVCKIQNDISIFVERYYIDSLDAPINIRCLPDTLYQIQIYSDSDLLCQFMHYQIDEVGAASLWQENIDELTEIEKAIAEDLQLVSGEIPFTTKEKQLYIEEKKRNPKNYLVPRIYIDRTAIPGNAVISIDNFEELKATGLIYYISAKEFDLMADQNYDRLQPLTKGSMNYNLYENNISGDAIFYIKDENNHIVSNYTRYNENDEYIDYENNKQIISIQLYTSQLLKEIKPYIENSNTYTYITTEINRLTQESGATKDSVVIGLVMAIARSNYAMEINKNQLIHFILSNWFSYFDIKDYFFSNNAVAFYHANYKLSVEARENPFILIHIGSNITNNKIDYNYLTGSSEESIALKTNQYDFNIIYAIDITDYKRSYFIFINNIKGEDCMITNGFTIEVNEIDG